MKSSSPKEVDCNDFVYSLYITSRLLVSSSTCADKVSRRPRLALSCFRAASKLLSQTFTCSSYALISVSNDSICLRHASRSVVGKILDKASILACTELS